MCTCVVWHASGRAHWLSGRAKILIEDGSGRGVEAKRRFKVHLQRNTSDVRYSSHIHPHTHSTPIMSIEEIQDDVQDVRYTHRKRKICQTAKC